MRGTFLGAVSLIGGDCRLYGFSLNFKRGKTEAAVHLAGARAREAAIQCFARPLLDFESQAGPCQLRLVSAYQHLGTQATFIASMFREASQHSADCKEAGRSCHHGSLACCSTTPTRGQRSLTRPSAYSTLRTCLRFACAPAPPTTKASFPSLIPRSLPHHAPLR